jgi:hypothetical protein
MMAYKPLEGCCRGVISMCHSVKQGLDCLRNYRREFDEKRQVFFDKPLHDWS